MLLASSTTDWVTAIGTGGATIAAVVLGLGFSEWWRRPKLKVRFRRGERAALLLTGAVEIAGIGAAPMADRTVHLLLHVRNHGRSGATNVRVALLGIQSWSVQRKRWEEVGEELAGYELRWWGTDPAAARQIARGSERPFALLSIPRDPPEKGGRPMTLTLAGAPPRSEAHILQPGAWQLTLEITSDEAQPRRLHLALSYDGNWTSAPAPTVADLIRVEGPSRRGIDQPPS